MPISDLNIILALKENNEQVLKEVFHLHFNRLQAFAVEFVIDKEAATEIVHDAILKFWQHRHNLRDDTNVKAYLYKIVRNLCLNYIKRIQQRNPLTLSGDDQLFDLTLNYEVLSDPDWDKLLVNELEEILQKTISSLPDKCRNIFELSRFGQFSNQEIADKLNISVKTVEGNITEALKIIRHKLSKYLTVIVFLSLP